MPQELILESEHEWVGIINEKIVASADSFKELVEILKQKNLLKKATVTKISKAYRTLQK